MAIIAPRKIPRLRSSSLISFLLMAIWKANITTQTIYNPSSVNFDQKRIPAHIPFNASVAADIGLSSL